MPFKPGHKKLVGCGRPKGALNKDHRKIYEIAEKLQIDPFEILLLFAAGDWKRLGYRSETMEKISKDCISWEYTVGPAVRMKAASEACQYFYPKKAAIQHKLENAEGEEVGFKVIVLDYTRKEEDKK